MPGGLTLGFATLFSFTFSAGLPIMRTVYSDLLNFLFLVLPYFFVFVALR